MGKGHGLLRVEWTYSTAAVPQSSPWLCASFPMPLLCSACSSVRQVKTPKMTGTLVSRPMRMRPWQHDSEMYSKCIVDPLIRTPTPMTASNGFLDAVDDDALSPSGSSDSSEDAPIRSSTLDEAWTCPAEMSLATPAGNSQLPGTDSMTMFSSFTPAFFIALTAPLTSGPMHSEFQRAWTIPIRIDAALGKDAGGAEGPLKVNLAELAAVGGDIIAGYWRSPGILGRCYINNV